MIPRSYFYLIETQDSNSNYGWGLVTAKSWLADPGKVSRKVIEEFCEHTGKTPDVCKMISFNRT